MYWEPCLAVMCLIQREWKKGGLGSKSLRLQVSLRKPMRTPGAVILSGGVPLLNSGPKLEPLLISINALSMVGEGGRNITYKSSRWRLHSLLGLPEANSKPHFAQEALLKSAMPLQSCSPFSPKPESGLCVGAQLFRDPLDCRPPGSSVHGIL